MMTHRLWSLLPLFVVLLAWSAGGALAQCVPGNENSHTLNVSTDLTEIGESSNMRPNDPNQDSTGLLNDAIAYVSKHPSCTRIIADRGAYYFATTTTSGTSGGRTIYAKAENLKNLTIDLQGSDLYFEQAAFSAFYVSGCDSCTLRDFTVDYRILPFTQLRVKAVNPVNSSYGTITAVPIGSYVSPTVLYASQVPYGADLYGFDLRGGQPQYTWGRWTVAPPLVPTDILTLEGDTSSIQRGDTFVVSARGGGPAIWIENSKKATLYNLSIYSSGGPAIISESSDSLSIEQIRIRPRPLTDRLVSTNAGGIELNDIGHDNKVRDCEIIRSQDDSIAGYSQGIGTVSDFIPLTPANTFTFQNAPTSPVAMGETMFFVDAATGLPIGQTTKPPYGKIFTITSVSGSAKDPQVTVNSSLPENIAGAFVFNSRPDNRGKGLLVEHNLIEDSLLARGIALSGMTDVRIVDNSINSTQQAGIVMNNNLASNYGPVSNIVIHQNQLLDTDMGVAGLGGGMLGAIEVISLNGIGNGDLVGSSPNHEIIISRNLVAGTLRSGIWVDGVASGDITGNILSGTSMDPTVGPDAHLPTGLSIMEAQQSFMQAIFTLNSNVIVQLNDPST